MKNKGWKSAFPVTQVVEQYRNGDPMDDLMLAGGLTKRELFAGLFMAAGMITNALVNKTLGDFGAQAQDACAAADALLAETEKEWKA